MGSIAVGDLWIVGRSDRDIVLVFDEYGNQTPLCVKEALRGMPFDDTYQFTPLPIEEFRQPHEPSFAFSGKFRSRVLHGPNVIDQVELPSREQTERIYSEGLEVITRRLASRSANSVIWSEKKVRNEFWKLFKHAFMYLAIKDYHDSGSYPQRRQDLVGRVESSELASTLLTLNSINTVSKEEILRTAENLEKYLRDLK